MKPLIELVKKLEESSVYSNWLKENPKAFLSHLFLQIKNDFSSKGEWDIGYYNPENEKVTIFSYHSEDNFYLKNTDDVFAKDLKDVLALDLEEVVINFEKAKEEVIKKFDETFPAYKELLGDGFVILQKLDGQVVWNTTLITKKLTMINVKLSAIDGALVSSDEVNFLDSSDVSS